MAVFGYPPAIFWKARYLWEDAQRSVLQDLLDQDVQPQNEMPFIDTMCLVRQMGICSVDHRSVTLVDFQIVVTGLTDDSILHTWGG
jgi:hypothetical protein